MKSIQKLTTQGAISLCVLLILNACKPDNIVEAPQNPCGDNVKPYAIFLITPTNPLRKTLDTLHLASNKLRVNTPFLSWKKYTSKWYTNNELQIQNMSSWEYSFSGYKHNEKITIKHVLEWKVNSTCCINRCKNKDSSEISFRITYLFNDLNSLGLYHMVYDTLGAPAKQDSISLICYLTNEGDEKDTLEALNPAINTYPYYYYFLRVKGLTTWGARKFPDGYKFVTMPSHYTILESRYISNSSIISSGYFYIEKFQLYIAEDNKYTELIYTTRLSSTSGVKQYKLKGIKHKRNKNVKHINTSPYAQPE